MTKTEARRILETWIDQETRNIFGERRQIILPHEDKVIMSQISFDEEEGPICKEWTFIGLLKIVYDL
jgi:hypothetical protein